MVVGPGKERQFTMAGHPVEECLGLCWSGQGIGLTGQYQDRNVGGYAADRLEGRDFLEVGQEEGTNQPQAKIAKLCQDRRQIGLGPVPDGGFQILVGAFEDVTLDPAA